MRVGFIGLGNMGAAMAAGILESGAVSPSDVLLANRSRGKAEALAERFRGTTVVEDNRDAAERSDVLFVTVRTDQLLGVLKDISPVRAGVHVVVVNGAVPLVRLEEVCGAAVSKLVPSVTMERGRGVSLLSHGPSVTGPQMGALGSLLSPSSLVKELPEGSMDAAADLTSCGPALIAEMMQQFAESGARHGIGRQDAWEMVLETLQGTALTLGSGEAADSLKDRVATKGGITEQGLKVLRSNLPQVFDQVMEETLAKHAEARSRLSERS